MFISKFGAGKPSILVCLSVVRIQANCYSELMNRYSRTGEVEPPIFVPSLRLGTRILRISFDSILDLS